MQLFVFSGANHTTVIHNQEVCRFNYSETILTETKIPSNSITLAFVHRISLQRTTKHSDHNFPKQASQLTFIEEC